MRKFLSSLLLLSLFLGLHSPVQAQAPALADLYPADTSAFPTVSALLDVFDERGVFATGLTRDAVTVIEDRQPIKPDELTEEALPARHDDLLPAEPVHGSPPPRSGRSSDFIPAGDVRYTPA